MWSYLGPIWLLGIFEFGRLMLHRLDWSVKVVNHSIHPPRWPYYNLTYLSLGKKARLWHFDLFFLSAITDDYALEHRWTSNPMHPNYELEHIALTWWVLVGFRLHTFWFFFIGWCLFCHGGKRNLKAFMSEIFEISW